MTAANKQVLELAKKGLSPQEIATALSYDVGLVQALLVEREVDKGSKSLSELFGDSDLEAAKDALVEVARFGENEGAKVKAAQFIIEIKTGIKAPESAKSTLNIGELNIQINKVRERLPMSKVEVLELSNG